MILRLTAFVAASFAAAIFASVPTAHADAAQDQQYLDMIRSNGVGGQDETLLAYARQVCEGRTDFSLVPDLMNQIGWFNAAGVYVIQTAATRVYCPNRIIQPPYQPPVVIGY